MIFNFNYRNEFSIRAEADNEEDARALVLNGFGEMKIENLGGLWDEYLELDGVYDNYEEV